jgi:hypothetical protein
VRRIIFRADLADRIAAGVKTETRRELSDKPRSPWFRERCAFDIGDSAAVVTGRGTPPVGVIVVEAVDKVRLGTITHDSAVAEGFGTRAEFVDAWRAINGRWDPDALVWRLTFHAEPFTP